MDQDNAFTPFARRFKISLAAMLLSSLQLLSGTAWCQDTAAASAAPRSSTAVPGEDYVLGAGDMVRITVFQNPDLTLETRLGENGTVSFPLLGQIKLGGLSLLKAQSLIEAGLVKGGYLVKPYVTIVVSEVRGHRATVLGHVAKPGRYALEQAGTTLSELLAMAGGIAPEGSDVVTITGTRDGAPYQAKVTLQELAVASKTSSPWRVHDGDVVFIDRVALVYIYGEVQRPGQLRLERGMTVMQAVAAGGGLTQRGTERGLQVRRADDQGRVQTLKLRLDEPLRGGDVIYLRESLF